MRQPVAATAAASDGAITAASGSPAKAVPSHLPWSTHAYGLAIDVNTVQNPYLEAGAGVQPPAGATYVSRSVIRPGMAYPGGILVSAFGSAGWGWGGYWAGSPDYQHFSVNGR